MPTSPRVSTASDLAAFFLAFFCGHSPVLTPALHVAPSFLKMSQTIVPVSQ